MLVLLLICLFLARGVEIGEECENQADNHHHHADNPVKNKVAYKGVGEKIHARGDKEKIKQEFRQIVPPTLDGAEGDIHNDYRHRTAKPEHEAERAADTDDIE